MTDRSIRQDSMQSPAFSVISELAEMSQYLAIKNRTLKMFTVAQIANRYKHIPCRELCISVVSSRRGRYETAKIPIQVEVFAVFCI